MAARRIPNMFFLLFLAVFPSTAGKYVHVSYHSTWHLAQDHCNRHYTDLAPVSNDHDRRLLQKTTTDICWIGLMRNPANPKLWQWSGGAEVLTFFWAQHEPNGNTTGEDAGLVHNTVWYDNTPIHLYPFLCYKVHAIRIRMSWFDALDYCRSHHQDLASVASETEMMLIQKELSKGLSSYSVWIGLQFLAGEWLWTDGQPFTFESWGPNPKPICPDMRLSCGAIGVSGDWLKTGTEELLKGWNSLDCNVKQHFLCY